MRIRLFCGIVVLALFSAANLCAQDTGVITGTVRDNSGAVIQGAEVQIEGTADIVELPEAMDGLLACAAA